MLPPLTFAGPKTGPAFPFVRDILATFSRRQERGPIARSAGPKVQLWLDRQWHQFTRSHPGPWIAAPDLPVYGLAAWLDYGEVRLRWETRKTTTRKRLPPSPYETGEPIPLGTWSRGGRTYRLECVYHAPTSPLLVAEWEENREEWRLYYHNQDTKPGPALAESIRRACLVNALAGTQWARPAPAGSIAVPYQPSG